jgi:hypothetical protein
MPAGGRQQAAARAGERRVSGALTGESIKALPEYLGHADPGFTLRTCTHLMPSSEARTRKAIDRMRRNGLGAPDGLTTAHKGP